MTRLWILSDLHLGANETSTAEPLMDIPDADVAVVAGDVTDDPGLAMRWLAAVIGPRMPVVAVLGNHEFWGGAVPSVRAAARRVADKVGVHLLDDSVVTVAGVRFVGGALWTDWHLYGPEPGRVAKSMRAARTMADFRQILAGEPAGGAMAPPFTPRDSAALHAASRAFIDAELARPHAGPSVVVTHHAPSPRSVPPIWVGHHRTPAFVSDLGALIEAGAPALWVHGHVHASFDYRQGSTRVVCNPKGYEGENPDFDAELVVEVDG